jgi:thiamine-phosphate pyrophosphorylase
MRGYYFITDSPLSRAGNASDVKNALVAGVRFIQYREKNKNSRDMYLEALEIRSLCENTKFIINDRVDIALSVGADGVHLGQDDLPCDIARKLLGKAKIIGITVHSVRQAVIAQKMGADYAAVSPIFQTGTKTDAGEPVGVDLIRKIKKVTNIPVVAIGGITIKNASKVIAAGADALCAISDVVTKQDVKEEIKKFQKFFKV